MPPRENELPEGTDKIVTGASAEQGGSNGGGFVATGNGGGDSAGGSGGSSGATDKLVSQVKEQVVNLRGQATDKLRGFADDGKGRATTLLDDVASIIEDAARSIDERLGGEYGGYAHSASEAVSSFAGKIRDKSVDDLVDDTRDIVRKSPAVAIAAAAVVGFALMRVVRTGLDGGSGSDDASTGSRPGGGRTRRTTNADTTTSGGA
jgi:ElaB/YqjD/DUF883 family membrane-anchored ribosome-binding protein